MRNSRFYKLDALISTTILFKRMYLRNHFLSIHVKVEVPRVSNGLYMPNRTIIVCTPLPFDYVLSHMEEDFVQIKDKLVPHENQLQTQQIEKGRPVVFVGLTRQ